MGDLILKWVVRQAPAPRIWGRELSFPKRKRAGGGNADPRRKENWVRLGPGLTISPIKTLKWFIA